MNGVLVPLRPGRAAMPEDPTPEEARVEGDALVAAGPAVTSGVMIPELRPLPISIR